jgi:hypothetical protein
MPLRGPRFSGDPVLEQCFAGQHRMMSPEEGLAVKRVQAALIELGRSVGPGGADGVFGQATGTAVTAYKTFKGLVPNDPVVGPGTAKALDDDLFFDPPVLDPAFGEFSPAVVDHRLEPFVGLELAALLSSPLDSWRHMLARFALNALNSGQLLGAVAQSRALDLRNRYLAVADAVQPNGLSAADAFDDAIIPGATLGNTIIFLANGTPRAFIVIKDDVVLGRAVITRTSDGTRAPVTLQGVIVHELTHARNLANTLTLLATTDADTNVYVDTSLAQARSAAASPTANVLRSYVNELVARHVHWIVQKELAGTPGGIAIRTLDATKLAAAALFYFIEFPTIYDSNGYGAGINAQGDNVRFRQLELWLKRCAAQSFNDIASEDQQARLLFQAAAQFCANQLVNPTLDFPEADGLFPLPQDFS